MRRPWLLLLAVLPACELREITTAVSERLVIAELVLVAEADTQYAWLHRSASPGDVPAVLVLLEVTDEETGASMLLDVAPDSTCLSDVSTFFGPGTCYRVRPPAAIPVHAGHGYALAGELIDGGALSARTVVPAAFTMLRPARPECWIPPDTPLELVWSVSPDAWAYLVHADFEGLLEALAARGVDVGEPDLPMRITGLAIGARDTTLVLPGELGVFDRFSDDWHDVLLAIRNGLPPGVRASVVVAAADRNYANWVRGGSFNPSGFVRIPSIHGAATGVFGSVSVQRFRIHSGEVEGMPRCD